MNIQITIYNENISMSNKAKYLSTWTKNLSENLFINQKKKKKINRLKKKLITNFPYYSNKLLFYKVNKIK